MKLKILLVTVLAMAFFGVVAFADYDPDNPGQIIDNPWADLFTTQATTEAPTEAPTEESTEAPTEAPTEESTEAPTAEPTTESGDFDLTTLDPQGENKHFTVGNFGIYLAGSEGVVVDAGIDPQDDNHLRIYYRATGPTGRNDKWNLQPYLELSGLNANETYNITWTLTSDSTKDIKANYYNGGKSFPLNGGVNTIVGTKDSDADGNLKVALGLAAMYVDTTVDLTDLIITDSNGKQVYPKKDEPTTEAPTEESTEAPTVEPSTEEPTVEPSTEAPTVEPSTEAPTEESTEAPTAEPTTVEPSTEETTVVPTVVPTTQIPTVIPVETTIMPTPVPVLKVPDKTKVTKIYKKKKSAKKIKIKIKKTAGATGYQVAIYKSKKNAKKNKKALVKKYVKFKKKITIKSKKIKNKKKLFVRARAYVLDGTTKLFGPWSNIKKAKIKK